MKNVKPFLNHCYAKTKTMVLVPFKLPSRLIFAFENRKTRRDLTAIHDYLYEERRELQDNLMVTHKKLESHQKQYQKKIAVLKEYERTVLALTSEKAYLIDIHEGFAEEIDELKRFSFQDIDSLSELKKVWLSGMIRRINQIHGYHLDAYTRADEKNRQTALAHFLSVNEGLLSHEEIHQFKLEANYQESLSLFDVSEEARTEEEVVPESQAQLEKPLSEMMTSETGKHWPHRLYDSANPSSYSDNDDESEWPRRSRRTSH